MVSDGFWMLSSSVAIESCSVERKGGMEVLFGNPWALFSGEMSWQPDRSAVCGGHGWKPWTDGAVRGRGSDFRRRGSDFRRRDSDFRGQGTAVRGLGSASLYGRGRGIGAGGRDSDFRGRGTGFRGRDTGDRGRGIGVGGRDIGGTGRWSALFCPAWRSFHRNT